ncbi:MAG: hypothetical protein ACYCPM_13500, partial [Acidobacteriaceae bacterium]
MLLETIPRRHRPCARVDGPLARQIHGVTGHACRLDAAQKLLIVDFLMLNLAQRLRDARWIQFRGNCMSAEDFRVEPAFDFHLRIAVRGIVCLLPAIEIRMVLLDADSHQLADNFWKCDVARDGTLTAFVQDMD